MGGRSQRRVCVALLLLGVAGRLSGATDPAPQLRMEVAPDRATVGDQLQAELTLVLPGDATIDGESIGPQLGPFAVESESWRGPEAEGEGEGANRRWTWNGTLITFRTGEVEVPAVRVGFQRAGGERGSVESSPVPVTIQSVLDPAQVVEGQPAEIADIKPPASLRADYSSMWTAAGLLALLLIGAAVLWWLQRRYASKLSRVEMPEDPFLRTPPHVWVYAELQKLLEQRLAEQGKFERFYTELSRILKRYLTGRYRVELMEHTTAELPELLRQSRVPEDAIVSVTALLGLADQVKFARESPDEAGCRRSIEAAYEIVDATKSREQSEIVQRQGAA